MPLSLENEIRLLRYLVATKALAKTGPDQFTGTTVKNHVRTKEFRLNAQITRESDGTTIQSIAWQWQQRDTGLPPRRHVPRQGATHS